MKNPGEPSVILILSLSEQSKQAFNPELAYINSNIELINSFLSLDRNETPCLGQNVRVSYPTKYSLRVTIWSRKKRVLL